MKYYKLVYDYEHDDRYVNCTVRTIGGIDEYATSNGKLIQDWKEVVLEYNPNNGNIMTDYVANVYRWLIVSNKFRSEIKEIVSDKIQYLPIKIVNSINKEENSLYQVANILDVVDALDLDSSQYDIFELDDEKIISVEKYALKKTKIQEHHIFRLKNDTIPVFVSEKIKNIVEKNKLLGFAFIEVVVN